MSDTYLPILFFYPEIDPQFKKAFVYKHFNFLVKKSTEKSEIIDFIGEHKYFIFISDASGMAEIRGLHKKFPELAERVALIGLGEDAIAELLSAHGDVLFESVQTITLPPDYHKSLLALMNASNYLKHKRQLFELAYRLNIQAKELHELNDIGVALSAERDPDKLLETILSKSREITGADAGSLYLVEKIPDREEDSKNYLADKQLRFKLAHCDTIPIDFTESVMPIEKKSIAGNVALTGKVLNISDVYELSKESGLTHNRSFDEAVGYRTKSMLVIPMLNHKDEMIGVLQLINRKKHWDVLLSSPAVIEEEIIEFDEKCVDLASSLASQAAVSIENNRLYEDIKNLFEGFIKASVHAIEQRDPTTFGHSERVATLTSALAKQVDRIGTGKFKDVHFSREEFQQIQYAALLHDFGKIGVRENILVKAKKLFPYELDTVKNRFKILTQATKLKSADRKIKFLLDYEKQKAMELFERLDWETQEKIRKLDEFLQIVCEVNEPTVLNDSKLEKLQQIATLEIDANGKSTHLLTEEEIARLSIPKGSLSNEERLEIESHVTHTYNFLEKIPWTRELRSVPEIAYAHHEKLDGSGYPRRLSAPEIPIQSRMMVIADIYDALTAWDRPYKKAVPEQKALDIIGYEVKDGKVDAELFKIFIEAKLFELVKKPDETS
ncbi:MAG: GAF domain-containing protein [Calditrichaeota bacterium]|nr:GAF domain-containing protein [Calditrichota bacterium]